MCVALYLRKTAGLEVKDGLVLLVLQLRSEPSANGTVIIAVAIAAAIAAAIAVAVIMARVDTSKVHRQVFDCLWVLLYTVASLSFSLFAFPHPSRQFVPITTR
ncbi:hypothetical protein G6011_05993 [Alternaria panax]|uniref:Uncharacterized protein n=1 Tax=Alternaria panax TaxID=48097 RepID=A0AAD4FGT9_9PLEO|nr:hypothetical protein G6011_05993 [Alternaria panax]